MNLAVLASHEGTTLQAVLDAIAQGRLPARMSVVISNNGDSGALRRARAAGIPAVHLSSVTHPDPGQLDRAILAALDDARADAVLLAGYMRKLGPAVLRAYAGRIVNTHPALLPRFGGKGMYGDRVHEAVLASGDSETGVSIHLVDGEYDTGPVLAQCRVPVLPGDSVADLSARVRAREKEFVVELLARMAEDHPAPERSADELPGPGRGDEETLEQRIRRAVQEEVAIAPYDPGWPEAFLREKEHLLSCLPADLVGRVEHFGSTAVPGLAAKPIVDVLVEVADLEATRLRIAPILEAQGYDYFWRPTHGDDGPPFYAWFIKRDASGVRTHHIHMVERHFVEHWDRLLFRDHLIDHPEVAREYEALKLRLAADFPRDRVAYTHGKTEFILRVTEEARRSRGAA